jgi:hypothetical protein
MINENLTMQNKTKKLFLLNFLTLLTHQLQKTISKTGRGCCKSLAAAPLEVGYMRF